MSSLASPASYTASLPMLGHLWRRAGIGLLLLLLCGVLFFYGLDTGELYQTESLRDPGGGVSAQRQLDRAHPLRRAAADQAAGDVCRHRPGELAQRKRERRHGAFALGVGGNNNRLSVLCDVRPAPGSTRWTGRRRAAARFVFMAQSRPLGRDRLGTTRLGISSSTMFSSRFGGRGGAGPRAVLARLAVVATRARLRGRRYADQVDGAGILLFHGLASALVARPTANTGASRSPNQCVPGCPGFFRLGGGRSATNGLGNLSRFTWERGSAALSPAHHGRPYPWHELILFPVQFLAANLPWSVFALLTLRPGFFKLWDERGRCLLQFLHCWTWPNLLFWTVVPGHHVRHSLPLQPGLAGLAAMVWIAWLNGRLHWPLPRLRPGRVFLSLVVLWLMVKLIFVHAIAPSRNPTRQPRLKGEQIAALVPADETLYLFKLKDEGILFYYGRQARRLPGPSCLPISTEGAYCLLVQSEWQQWPSPRRAEILLRLCDEQGAPIMLAKVF